MSIATNKNRKDILVVLYAKMKERKGHHAVSSTKFDRFSSEGFCFVLLERDLF